MWRKLFVILFFVILAQPANALPSLKINNTIDNLSHIVLATSVINLLDESSLTASLLDKIEHQNKVLEQESNDHLVIFPQLIRASASSFLAEIQANPNYVVVIEFFAEKLTAALFKNLTNPPLIIPWFEQTTSKTSSSRLAGWKDSNTLYSSVITYHS